MRAAEAAEAALMARTWAVDVASTWVASTRVVEAVSPAARDARAVMAAWALHRRTSRECRSRQLPSDLCRRFQEPRTVGW